MPLYLVRHKDTDFKETVEAVSPSRAACKAFHILTRKHPSLSEPVISVITEGKRYDQCYRVALAPVENPTAFERTRGIAKAAKATKVYAEHQPGLFL
jgi:hypothetical protein